MHYFNKGIGNLGENIAANYLNTIGYKILEKNFTCKIGEIDLIGKDKNHICFIEVKTRYNCNYGRPIEAITYKKQLKIYKTAKIYILKKKLFNYNFRFDVIEIILNSNNNYKSINLIKNAFQI